MSLFNALPTHVIMIRRVWLNFYQDRLLVFRKDRVIDQLGIGRLARLVHDLRQSIGHSNLKQRSVTSKNTLIAPTA